MDDITALSGGDSKKKRGILSSAPSSGFLCHTAISGRFKTFQLHFKSLVIHTDVDLFGRGSMSSTGKKGTENKCQARSRQCDSAKPPAHIH